MSEILNKKIKSKKAQEEMIGFGVIIAVVAVVILVFLFFSISSDEESFDSSKVESFVQAVLSYTTQCEKYQGEYMDTNDLIYSCANKEMCVDGNNSCNVLNSTLSKIINQTWPAGQEWPTKAYEFLITTKGSESEDWNVTYSLEKGNKTNYTIMKSGMQTLPPRGDIEKVKVQFTVYQ